MSDRTIVPDAPAAGRADAAATVTSRVRATSTAGLLATQRWAARLAPGGERVAALVGPQRLFGADRGDLDVYGGSAEVLGADLNVALPDGVARRWAAAVGADELRLLATLVLLAGAVAARYERRDDLLVGVCVDGHGLVPLRVPPPDDAGSVAAWLTAAECEVAAALADAHSVPADAAELVSAGLAVGYAGAAIAPRTPLLLLADADSGRVRLSLRRRPDVSAALAARVAAHLGAAAQSLLGPACVPPGELDLLGRAERRLLAALRGPRQDSWPEPELLPDRVRRHARRDPEATALVWPGTSAPPRPGVPTDPQRYSYRQLVAAADALGARLDVAGLRQGDRVAVLLERGPAVVVAALACLDRGLCYLPLDPAHPARRVAALIEDAEVAAVLAGPGMAEPLDADGRPVLALTASPGPAAELGRAPRPRPDTTTPAYAIYTSGSTGAPKAVLVPHGAYAATCDAYTRQLGLDEPAARPVGLQLAPFTFDVFNGDLARVLYHGGTLVLCPDETRTDPDAVAELLREHRVSIVEATPALINPLADTLAAGGVPGSLRTVLCGSDAWADADVRRVRAALGPAVALYNTYGVTEAAIDSTYYRIADLPAGLATAPIGQPLARVRLHVVDHRGRPVPPGIPGELCIAGPAVAIGYLGHPELTAQRFGVDPDTGERSYRTGDLVRLGSDGALQFLGRLDNQLKVNGVRVEPGEIEQVLAGHPEVSEAVVLTAPGPAGPRLVGYLVRAGASGGAPPTVPAGLRDYCRQRLPAGLVPSNFVALDGLPVTANGKLDRSALPPPPADGAGEYVAPRTELERLLARLCADELGSIPIGRDDDFFALGGHSLAAARVLARLHGAIGVRLGLRTLFDAPTVAGLAAAVGTARAARPDALPSAAAFSTPASVEAASPLHSRDRSELEPIAPVQARLWFLEQMHPGTTLHTVPVVLRIDGPLDPAALRRCLAAWVWRHDALRTTYREERGEPVALVGDPGLADDLDLPVTDLRDDPTALAVAAGAQPVEVLDPVRRVLDTPFDVATGPMLRAVLVRVVDDLHLLAVAIHHLACDGASVVRLRQELARDYPLAVGDRPLPSRPGPAYAEYARRQRKQLRSSGAADVAFWRDRLAGVPDLALPYDVPPTSRTAPPAGRCGADLPGAAIERLARAQATTPFVVLLAAAQATLWRWCRQDRFAVGTVSSGRTTPEDDELVGFLVNTIALPADLSSQPSFAKLIGAARRTMLEAYSHQQTPFDQVVSALGRAGDATIPPVFQVCLTVEDTRNAPASAGPLTLTELLPEPGSARFDLTLDVTISDAGYRLSTIYAADRFDRVSIERWQRSMLTFLAAALDDPNRRVADLPFVAPEDRAQQRRWGTGPRQDDSPGTLHGPVLRHARKRPDAIALIEGTRQVSYAQLVADAVATARRLPPAPAQPSPERHPGAAVTASVVAVCLPRSAVQLTAVLAVLISGHAYLPLEPDLPPERALAIARAGGARAVLTSAELSERFCGLGVPVLIPEPAPAGTEVPLPPEPEPDRAAYVMYTSGSTGAPKGVVVGHAAVDNRLSWGEDSYPSHDADRFLFKTAYGFDISVTEMFWPLRAGRTLVIAGPGGQRDPGYLAGLVREHRITTLHFVPSLLAAFLQESSAAECRGIVRRIFCSGEALPQALLTRTREVLGVPVHNLYGPTETTIEVTAWDADQHPGRPVAIGRPVRNSWVRVLDERLRELPIGAAGELCVGGRQLAYGYLGQLELTAQHFVTAPDGARLYRTGDQVRWGSDGELLFLGRLDDQVKIDGRRVELGEISAALEQHPNVLGAAVMFRPDRRGPARLVGYYVPREADVPQDLHEFLRSRLPEYMTPTSLVALEHLPMTPNGKLDRAALPEPADRADTAVGDYVAPGAGRETEIAQVWGRVLHLDRVGARDDFFALGGHSLLAIRMLAELTERTGARVPVRTLFDGPTVAQLAQAVDRLVAAAAGHGGAAGEVASGDRLRGRPVPSRHERSRFRAAVGDGSAPAAGGHR